jgi:tRNA pseudouridine13 synthase
LSGNRFKIVIREIDEQNNSIIESGIESLKKNGFINYFGLQRFGSCTEAPTHLIGSKLK